MATRLAKAPTVQLLVDAGADTRLRNNRQDLAEMIKNQQGGKKRPFGLF